MDLITIIYRKNKTKLHKEYILNAVLLQIKIIVMETFLFLTSSYW